jgi:non-ribosomal peptide synthetase-like protein
MFRNWTMLAFTIVSSVMLYRGFGEQMFESSLFAGALLSAYAMALLFIRSFYNILYERAANWYRPMKPRVCSLYERAFWDHERYWKLSTDRIRDQAFAGTPIKNLISRCQGVRLGKQVFDNGCNFPEPFLVKVGDHCAFNRGSAAQGHSMEDGTFKCDTIQLGDRCTLGVQAFVHYSVDMGDDVDIRTDAFVMKGSIILDRETWTGNPAQQMMPDQCFKGGA